MCPRTARRPSAKTQAPRQAPLTVSRPELLVEGSDRDFRLLVSRLFALAARHDTVRAGHAAIVGLTPPQYTVLVTCAHMQETGPVRIKHLAEHLNVSATFVTVEVKNLANRGLLHKQRNAGDSRVVDISVTDEGLDLLESLAPVQQQVNNQQFADITQAEFQDLLRLTETLIANSERAIALQSYLAAAPSATAQQPSRSR